MVALLVVGYMGGALRNKPNDDAHQTAQEELRKVIQNRSEELARLEDVHRNEIAALKKSHQDALEQLKAELAAKASVVVRQDKEIDSRNQSLLGWKTAVVVLVLVAFAMFVLGAIVGSAYKEAARKNSLEGDKGEPAV